MVIKIYSKRKPPLLLTMKHTNKIWHCKYQLVRQQVRNLELHCVTKINGFRWLNGFDSNSSVSNLNVMFLFLNFFSSHSFDLLLLNTNPLNNLQSITKCILSKNPPKTSAFLLKRLHQTLYFSSTSYGCWHHLQFLKIFFPVSTNLSF